MKQEGNKKGRSGLLGSEDISADKERCHAITFGPITIIIAGNLTEKVVYSICQASWHDTHKYFPVPNHIGSL
jgi:hypothetical protein